MGLELNLDLDIFFSRRGPVKYETAGLGPEIIPSKPKLVLLFRMSCRTDKAWGRYKNFGMPL